LVLNFHGYTSTAQQQMFYGDFRAIADTANFLLVHPQGTIDFAGQPHWNVGWGTSNVDDVGFTSALIDSLATNYAVDLDRIYSTGMSNGGFMSFLLACQLSDKVAAVASVTGSMTSSMLAECQANAPVPAMQIHGTADGVVGYNGGAISEPIEDVVNYWVDQNDCSPQAGVIDIPDVDPNDGCTAEQYVYSGGINGTQVEFFKVTDGGHTWPGSAFNSGVTNQDFNASAEIWRFFSQYDINGRIIASDIAEEDLASHVALQPNPATDLIQWVSEAPMTGRLFLRDMQGRLQMQADLLDQKQASLRIGFLPEGMYMLQMMDEQGMVRFSERFVKH
jgi:polyhydroxybutyrate depolymerase